MAKENLENKADENSERVVNPFRLVLSKKEMKNYYGKFIVCDFKNNKIVAYGADAGDVIKQAFEAGFEFSSLMFVPSPNISYVGAV